MEQNDATAAERTGRISEEVERAKINQEERENVIGYLSPPLLRRGTQRHPTNPVYKKISGYGFEGGGGKILTIKTKMPHIHNRKNLKPFRKSLRNNATSAEAGLWKILKKRQIGNLKFRRQHSIEKYIVDFYCPELKLAIELDGEYHSEPGILSEDYEKDECLEKNGVRTLRYENRWVFECPEDIINDILNFQTEGRNYVIKQSTTPLKSMTKKSLDKNS